MENNEETVIISKTKKSQRRRRRREDTWMTTYSDMVTLLLCFFILLVSVSKVDSGKAKEVSQELRKKLKLKKDKRSALAKRIDAKWSRSYLVTDPQEENGLPDDEPLNNTDRVQQAQKEDQEKEKFEQLMQEIDKIISVKSLNKKVEMVPKEKALHIVIVDAFRSGSDQVKPRFRKMVKNIAVKLTEFSKRRTKESSELVTIHGHTDSQKMGAGSVFRDNWQLGSARAYRILSLMQKQGLPDHLFKIESHGSNQSFFRNEIADPNTPLRQRKKLLAWNRRFVISIKNASAMKVRAKPRNGMQGRK